MKKPARSLRMIETNVCGRRDERVEGTSKEKRMIYLQYIRIYI